MTLGGDNTVVPCQSFNGVRGRGNAAREDRGVRGSEVHSYCDPTDVDTAGTHKSVPEPGRRRISTDNFSTRSPTR